MTPIETLRERLDAMDDSTGWRVFLTEEQLEALWHAAEAYIAEPFDARKVPHLQAALETFKGCYSA